MPYTYGCATYRLLSWAPFEILTCRSSGGLTEWGGDAFIGNTTRVTMITHKNNHLHNHPWTLTSAWSVESKKEEIENRLALSICLHTHTSWKVKLLSTVTRYRAPRVDWPTCVFVGVRWSGWCGKWLNHRTWEVALTAPKCQNELVLGSLYNMCVCETIWRSTIW